MRTAEDNAREYGALTRQGRDARLTLLVACSVEKGKRPPKAGYPRDYAGKVGAEAFAEMSETTHDRVLRHLAAWEKLAARGIVPPSDEMAPWKAEAFYMPDAAVAALEEWRPGQTLLASTGTAIKNNPRKTAELIATDDDFAQKIADDPAAVEAIVTRAIETGASGRAIADAVQRSVKGRAHIETAIADDTRRRGTTDPNKLDQQREEDRLNNNGAGLVELLELQQIAARCVAIAAKFRTADRYSQNARTIVDKAASDMIAAANHMRDVVNGDFDTRAPDDISGLVAE